MIELLHESILKKELVSCETNQDKEGNDETEDNDIGFGDYLRERRKHRPDMSPFSDERLHVKEITMESLILAQDER